MQATCREALWQAKRRRLSLRQMLTSLAQSLADRPDMQNAVARLMRPDDMLEAFSALAVKEPDLM